MKYLFSLIISGALVVSGFGQTRNVLVNTNNAVVQPANFWSADASNARSGLGLGTAATNPASAFQPSSLVLSNLASSNGVNLTNIPLAGVVGALATNGSAAGLTGFIGTTNAATARTNLGLGWSALTNTNSTNFRNVIGLGITNNVTFGEINSQSGIIGQSVRVAAGTNLYVSLIDDSADFFVPISINNSEGLSFGGAGEENAKGNTRTNLGIPWSGLTNTNAATFKAALFGANTNPVLVNTSGSVVSPTNFWQVAPIVTRFVEFDPATNATTNIAAARNLHIHSLTISRTGVTSTITLPTNGSTFDGDIALVVHQGPTNSMTRVRTAGSTNDLVTMTRFDEAVEFVYYENVWQFNHNHSFIEPIYFSGTNAAANAAVSRTNLGLGATNDVIFKSVASEALAALSEPNTKIEFQDEYLKFYADSTIVINSPMDWSDSTNAATTRTNLGLGATNNVTFNRVAAGATNVPQNLIGNFVAQNGSGEEFHINSGGFTFYQGTNTGGSLEAEGRIFSGGVWTFENGASTRGNIVISNQSTNNNGLLFIYRTNNEPFLGLANLIASNNTTTNNETLFRVGVAEATNKAAQFGFRATNTNGDGLAVFSTFGYNALMMVGPSDRSRTNYATNTNAGVEADVWSISPTNRVATLIDTNTGAFTFHRSIGFDTNVSSVGNTNLVPATNNQISKWLRVYIGTNTFYLPLYQ